MLIVTPHHISYVFVANILISYQLSCALILIHTRSRGARSLWSVEVEVEEAYLTGLLSCELLALFLQQSAVHVQRERENRSHFHSVIVVVIDRIACVLGLTLTKW